VGGVGGAGWGIEVGREFGGGEAEAVPEGKVREHLRGAAAATDAVQVHGPIRGLSAGR